MIGTPQFKRAQKAKQREKQLREEEVERKSKNLKS